MAADPADEARWAEALSLLDRVPTESAAGRLRRRRRRRLFGLVSALVVSTAVAVAAAVLFRSALEEQPAQVPTAQAVVGYVISAVGLVLQAWGVVAAWRTQVRLRAWSSPLLVLTSAQQRELVAQVRGDRDIEPARVPLARSQAEHLLSRRVLLSSWWGLETSWLGLWIAQPTVWRAVLLVGYGVLLAVTWSVAQRDVRRARRFLARTGPGR